MGVVKKVLTKLFSFFRGAFKEKKYIPKIIHMPLFHSHEVNYIASYPSVGTCPKTTKPEYAFIGRSNVGKSSLINMLTGRNGLARISKKPGKTQMINYFEVGHDWYLVDLPGYGYAKISKKKRKEWEVMIEGYLQHRKTLACVFLLIDANVPAQKIDLEFMNWLGLKQIPFVIVYTKTDRLKPHQVEPNIEKIQKGFLEEWEALPQEFVTSAIKKEGRDELLSFIDQLNKEMIESQKD